jgi:hypothetical protein
MRLMIDDDPARETFNPQIDANMAHTLNQGASNQWILAMADVSNICSRHRNRSGLAGLQRERYTYFASPVDLT